MLYPIPIAQQGVISDIEPMLSEVWREFGYESGTTNIENGEWQGGKVTFNQETLIDSGDK